LTVLLWLGFVALILVLASIEFGRLNRVTVTGRHEAMAWTLFWISLSLAFTVAIYFIYQRHWLGLGLAPGHELDGRTAALQFLTGYLVQKALSIDNIFVIALIFSHFRMPLEYHNSVLVPGIIVSILLRGAMITIGVLLIRHLPWTTYVFGVLLIFTALRTLAQRGTFQVSDGLLSRLVRRRYPASVYFSGRRFVAEADGVRAATPLLHALVMITSAGLVFAIDSVPAIMAVTQEPFIVFSSILFAMLGLHSLYFLLASIIGRLQYLKFALVCVLVFVGVKMLLVRYLPIPTETTLSFVSLALAAGVVASLFFRPPPDALVSPIARELDQFIALTLTSARRIVILVTGSTVVLVGIAMIVTPGPAILVIPLGLAILGTEFVWARRLLKRFRTEAKNLSGTALSILRGGRRKEAASGGKESEPADAPPGRRPGPL
jgi:tellurite resistance protein TerC